MISIGNLQINKIFLGDNKISKAYLGAVEVYSSKPKPEGKYMTITVDDSAGETTISPSIKGSLRNLNLQYRINSNGDWTNFIVGKTADIHLVSGDWIQFKGNNTSGLSTGFNDYIIFNISGNTVHLSGNVMSLIDGVGEIKVIPNDYCFRGLFKDTKIKTVSSDFLPATTLKSNCYASMFSGCTSLVTAPSLPATTMYSHCYYEMFSGCTSLVTAPSLPSYTLNAYCYYSMFSGCTSLVTAPSLPATTMYSSCYQSMFSGCTSLVTAPELKSIEPIDYCYYGMFSGCSKLNYVKCLARYNTKTSALSSWLSGVASSGTFVKSSGALYNSGSSGIPEGWTIQNI